jgi:hypothetical protein
MKGKFQRVKGEFMEFNHTCRKCKYLKLTYAKPNKEWTCEKKNKNKAFEETIFNNLCRSFESKTL